MSFKTSGVIVVVKSNKNKQLSDTTILKSFDILLSTEQLWIYFSQLLV